MRLITTKSILATAFAGAMLFAGAAHAASVTYSFAGTGAFLSGEVTVDGGSYDWSKLIVTPGNGGSITASGFFQPIQSVLDTVNGNELSFVTIDSATADKYTTWVWEGSSTPLSLTLQWSQRIIAGPFRLSPAVSRLSGSQTFVASPSVSSVPIPAAAFMFVPALLGFAALRRKSRA